jgi:diguanylate cyclase (GGDEF)-like protein
MQAVKQFLKSLVSQLLADIHEEGLSSLVHSSAHSPLLARRRAEIIISRVRLVSVMFALLTPLWIIVDVLVFSFPLSVMLMAGRLGTTFAFALLALEYRGSPYMKDAYRALVFMFFIPTAFFIYSHLLLADFQNQGGAAVIAAGYAFLPFVLVAGLSIFPLTALEGIVFSLPVLFSSALVAILQINQMNWSTHLGAFWLLLLIAGTATLAGMSQLAFMAALVHQANHDPLTHCFNRASGEELFNLQFSIAERNKAALAIVFVDIDNFKSINDKYGHDAGDRILTAAVNAIRNTLRYGDALVRWGGEEFLMVLPNTNCASAITMLERLRANGLGQRPDGNPLTASFGVAERLADSANSGEILVEIADQRMYKAKESGRDCWVSCNDASPAPASGSDTVRGPAPQIA